MLFFSYDPDVSEDDAINGMQVPDGIPPGKELKATDKGKNYMRVIFWYTSRFLARWYTICSSWLLPSVCASGMINAVVKSEKSGNSLTLWLKLGFRYS